MTIQYYCIFSNSFMSFESFQAAFSYSTCFIIRFCILYWLLKGTQDWDFFWLRFWNLYYFFVSYVKILRFYPKQFLIGPLLGEVRFFRVVLGLRRMKKKFELGHKIFFYFFICEPFVWANTSFSEIRSNNCARDGFKSQFWAKMSKFIPLSLRLSRIEFSLVSD